MLDPYAKRERPAEALPSVLRRSCLRAGNGTRTRDPNLGKVVLYQLSYSRVPPSLIGARFALQDEARRE